MPAMPRIDPPRLVQFAAVLAILAGLLFWGYLLLAPIPGVVQAEVADVPPPSGEDAAQRWFATPSSEVEVRLAGLISGGPAAIAILSVNGAPAQAYREGEVLARAAKVRRIEADAVLIEQNGEVRRVPMQRLAEPPPLATLKRG
ncbi:TPA: general secretion pathway protein GspC [Pseudomonas aeruginosa]|nr:general secretion pathway protein GspC [Pseudomonas aeruginosa]